MMKIFYFSLFSLLGVSLRNASTELPGDGDNTHRSNVVQMPQADVESGIIAPYFLRDYRNLTEEGETGSGKHTKNARSALHLEEDE